MQDRIREKSAPLQKSPEAHDVAQNRRASELQHEERRLRMRQSQSFKMENGRDSRREEQIERKRKGIMQETRSAAASERERARDQEADSSRLSHSYPLQQQSDDGHRDSPIEELQRAAKNLVQHVHMAEIERKLSSRSSSRGSNLTPQGMVPASAPANGAATKMWGGTTERGAEDDAPVKPEARRSRSFRDLSHSSRNVMEDSTDSAQDKKAQREARKLADELRNNLHDRRAKSAFTASAKVTSRDEKAIEDMMREERSKDDMRERHKKEQEKQERRRQRELRRSSSVTEGVRASQTGARAEVDDELQSSGAGERDGSHLPASEQARREGRASMTKNKVSSQSFKMESGRDSRREDQMVQTRLQRQSVTDAANATKRERDAREGASRISGRTVRGGDHPAAEGRIQSEDVSVKRLASLRGGTDVSDAESQPDAVDEMAFFDVDADGSGGISLDELRAVMLKGNPGATEAEVIARFKEMDVNNDGKISREEFAGSKELRRAERAARKQARDEARELKRLEREQRKSLLVDSMGAAMSIDDWSRWLCP